MSCGAMEMKTFRVELKKKKSPRCKSYGVQTFQNRLLTNAAEMSMNDDNHSTVMMAVITYNVKSVNNAEVENFSVAQQEIFFFIVTSRPPLGLMQLPLKCLPCQN
jgi:hypothetical protein